MFNRILIANRGEIACRIQRTCKRLGIETVAVYSEADKDALHVKAADAAYCVGPAPVRESYLNIEAILKAAKDSGAQAIHPGYGLLSEKENFAQAVKEAGLVYIGPPASCLNAFGDSPLDASDRELITREAERIGFPLLVKAAGGGGGIGMQIVETADKLARAIETCSDRGKSAFGDPRVYMERYVKNPKHIEVQVLCDQHGKGVALFERECSAQRRHQKVLEEAPSPAPFFSGAEGEARRAKLLEAALNVVQSVKYEGAGTVEFVASTEGELFFLEVNARLQVEHCVTEMITGIDLVEQQLRVAAGEPLSAEVLAPKRKGHSIEARIYAENPLKMFAPQPGRLDKIVWPESGEDVRIETGVTEGDSVTPFYDPMIAKLVVWAEDRAAALAKLDRCLESTQITLTGPAGPSTTNLEFLRKLAQTAEFAAGTYDTTTAETLAKALKAAAK
jgi:acetyl-CoA carboxylase biotin carboxylase subunit/3-methylcrotonyl-CoA carboxylase alpha subunit